MLPMQLRKQAISSHIYYKCMKYHISYRVTIAPRATYTGLYNYKYKINRRYCLSNSGFRVPHYI